jgi:hypothetical protein
LKSNRSAFRCVLHLAAAAAMVAAAVAAAAVAATAAAAGGCGGCDWCELAGGDRRFVEANKRRGADKKGSGQGGERTRRGADKEKSG